jgi:hypothetical protein
MKRVTDAGDTSLPFLSAVPRANIYDDLCHKRLLLVYPWMAPLRARYYTGKGFFCGPGATSE